ncbi:MAG TPA: hypothetical protein ENH15_02825, partial [Actinobacteria bacterium]|nr:hypothetical protein [Actinomycetota bacterium]
MRSPGRHLAQPEDIGAVVELHRGGRRSQGRLGPAVRDRMERSTKPYNRPLDLRRRMHGGQLVARALRAEGVDTIFALTGGHILPILDGCVLEGIRIVDVRHEQTAVHAAEAYGRLTGKLGVAVVTAGPGVTDAITGMASAHYSSTPLLLLGGRHYIRQETMGGLQEMNHPLLFGSITRWAATAWETSKLPLYIATAARHAFSGRGGPVFLDVPLDVQADMVRDDGIEWPDHYRPNVSAMADQATLVRIASMIAEAER